MDLRARPPAPARRRRDRLAQRWPPPAPVMLSVDAASVVLDAADAARRRRRCREFTPGAGPATSDDADGVDVWRVEHDVLGRETRVVDRPRLDVRRRARRRVEEHYRGEVGVSTIDPGDARRTRRRARDRVARGDACTARRASRCAPTPRRSRSTSSSTHEDDERWSRDRPWTRPYPARRLAVATAESSPAIVEPGVDGAPVSARVAGRAVRRCGRRAPGPRRGTARGCRAARPRPTRRAGSAGGSGSRRGSRRGPAARP